MFAYPYENFLLIAEAVLGVSAESLRGAVRVELAESALSAPFAGFGSEWRYPDPVDQAAVLCSRIVGNHSLPDGNKRVGLLCMLDVLSANGYELAAEQGERVEMIERLAGEDPRLGEEEFRAWVRLHVRRGD